MTMSSHSGSTKRCANTKCKKPLQLSTLSWKCPNGCLAVLCDQCSSCEFCINHRRSILTPNPARLGAPFCMRNSEGTSDIATSSTITLPSPAEAARTLCLLNSSNTEYVRPTPTPTPPSRLGERKNSLAKQSSQIRASQMIKDRTPLGIEYSRRPRTSFSSNRTHSPLSRVLPATPTTVKMQSITPPASSIGNLQLLNSKNGSISITPPASSKGNLQLLNSKNGSKSITPPASSIGKNLQLLNSKNGSKSVTPPASSIGKNLQLLTSKNGSKSITPPASSIGNTLQLLNSKNGSKSITPPASLIGNLQLLNSKNGSKSSTPPASSIGKNLQLLNSKNGSKSVTPPASSIGNLQLMNSKNGSKSLITAVKPQSSNGRKDNQLARYMPKITNQELKDLSRSLNGEVTPLFEKELTASDTGRIGRLVLPKRCAEAYFPQVSETLGEAMTIRDITGKDWDLNLRFWPNNNSRMYVLEGFNPIVKSMNLKEGDSVMFGRLKPGDKLVMICRKVKTASSSNQAMVTVSPHSEVSKGNASSSTLFPVSQMKPNNPENIQSEVVRAKSPVRAKRKSSKMGSTSEIIEPEKEMIELDLTSKEAQELIRPPPGSRVPKSVVIDGVEIMGYKDDPVIGRPTIVENRVNTMVQWAQCERCYKWRRVPFDIVIPAGWTCSQNQWDPQRSRCSDPQEMMSDMMIKEFFPRTSDEGSSKKMKIGNQQPEPPEKLVVREALAVIPPEENVPPPALPSPAKATTKHPRHRPGCSCIVCIQPPSGTKHSSTCTCGGCLTVRRRHQTVSSRRGKNKKPSGTTRRKRTRRPVNTRKPAAAVGGSELNQKKPTPQTEVGASTSNNVLMKPAAQQPASIIKPSGVGSSKSIIKPTEIHQISKCASAPANTSTERRLIDLNVVPEPDEEDFMHI